jgi:hypothetical protein
MEKEPFNDGVRGFGPLITRRDLQSREVAVWRVNPIHQVKNFTAVPDPKRRVKRKKMVSEGLTT